MICSLCIALIKKNLWGTWTINDETYLLAAVTYAGLVLSAAYLQFLLTADYVNCTSVIFEKKLVLDLGQYTSCISIPMVRT